MDQLILYPKHLGSIRETLQRVYKVDVEEALSGKEFTFAEKIQTFGEEVSVQDALASVFTVDWTAREYGGRVDLQSVRELILKR